MITMPCAPLKPKRSTICSSRSIRSASSAPSRELNRQLGQRPALPQRFRKRLLVENGGREIFLPVEQLDWAEAVRNYVVLHAGTETYTIRATLEAFARQLDPDQFARISRSELVNLDSVKEMQPWFHGERRIILKDGVKLTWTRRYRAVSSRD